MKISMYLVGILTILPIMAVGQSSDSVLSQLFERADTFEQDDDRTYPDVLPDAQKKRELFWAEILDELNKINPEDLDGPDQINYHVFKYVIQDRYDRLRLKTYLIPFNAEGGFYTRPGFMVRRFDFDEEDDYEKYGERMKAVPQYFEDNISLLKDGIESGILSPKLIAENYEVLIQPFLQTPPDSNILYRPYQKLPPNFTEHDITKWKDEGKDILENYIIPAYNEFDAFMREVYIPACPDEIGINKIPGGEEIYRQRISFYTSLDMSPEDVFARGKEEVARIRGEMEQIIEDLGFDGSFDDFLEFLRTDEQFYAKTPRQLLMEASYHSKRIDGLLPAYFNRLPTLPYGVEPVPAAIAPNYTGGRYSGGSWDNHRAGQYWVNTYKLESRPLYVLPSLTLHEAVPGHHLQIALSQELNDLPSFRNETYISAFGEGWALYCEWLGKEMEIYETAYEDFGRLTYEMWRACRLVVDVGMHMMDWSREEAFEFLSSNTALSIHECNTEINRYIGWPGQAVSYKIGELKIRELRKSAEEKLGKEFDLREFHDKVLENGSIPLFLLEQIIMDWMDSRLSP